MFLAVVITIGAFKAIHAGWRETTPFSRLIITQRRRYTFVLLGQVAITACVLWMIALASVNEIVALMRQLLSYGMFGWIFDLGMVLVVMSPLITALALISIYRNPAELAFKRRGRRGEYCRMGSRKGEGKAEREFVRPVIRYTRLGPVRHFEPIA